VFLFLYTDDFWRDFRSYQAKGVVFVREPKEEPYGTVAVFKDLYGNLWDPTPGRVIGSLTLFRSASMFANIGNS
jgi:hypothetical protein